MASPEARQHLQQEHDEIDAASKVRLGIDGIVEILHAHFAAISDTFRIRVLRNHPEICQYSPDDIIDP
jgi:hypothetical protein